MGYTCVFGRLKELALSPEKTARFVGQVIEEL
jgi:hypothetical protein